jgi:hypothetical protein
MGEFGNKGERRGSGSHLEVRERCSRFYGCNSEKK